MTSHRCLRRGSCASQHGSEIASSFLSYTGAEAPWPFPHPSRGSGTARPQGSTNSPPASPRCQGVAVRHTWDLAAPHWRSPFCSRVVSGHLLDRPSAQAAKPVANPQMCPPFPRWPWPCTKAVRSVSHNAQAAPPSLALAGDRNSSGHPGWLPSWDLRSDILGCSSDRVTGGLLAAGAGTREFSGCWSRAEQPSAALSTGVRGLGTRETPGVMGVCRAPCSWQQQLPPSPSSAGTAPPWQPLGGPGETAGPGLLQPFPVLCKRVVIKT